MRVELTKFPNGHERNRRDAGKPEQRTKQRPFASITTTEEHYGASPDHPGVCANFCQCANFCGLDAGSRA